MRRGVPVLTAAMAMVLAACGGSSPGPSSTTSTSTTSSSSSGPAAESSPPADVVTPGDRTVAIVADSEVPANVAELVADAEGIAVVHASSADGATMAELDATVDAALAQDPDVLVYAGGTNDLPSGPTVMLHGLEQRLRRYVATACVVVAVPIFRFHGTTDAEIDKETAGTRILESAVREAGAHVASYLDVALAMRAEGQDFFAEGELGDLHPGTAAHPRIAASIVDAIRSCPAA